MRCTLCLSLFTLAAAAARAASPGDGGTGKRLHDANCKGCHGTEVYIRANRLVLSLPALEHQLQRCTHTLRKYLSPEEKQHIVRYLNDEYYHFGRAAGNQGRIQARYETAGKIRSEVERDKRYAAVASQAAREHEFELAIGIASGQSSAARRDTSYAEIVYQAILARDFPAADKAARKMSSPALRDEQLRKIVGSCPPNSMTSR